MTGPLQSFAAAVLGMALAQGAGAAPRLQADSPDWDFGSRTNAGELTHDFTIRNSGNADLNISGVVPSCEACLHAAMETNRLAPGASAVVHARLDLSLANGPVTRDISIFSDDPDNGCVVLTLTGVSIPAYQVMPETLMLDLSAEKREATAAITPLYKPRAPLSRLECNDSNLTATLLAQGDGGYTVSVRAKASMPRGRFLDHLTLSSAESNDYPCRLKVVVDNPPDLEIIPERLEFEAQDQPQERILWVRQHGPAPQTLLDVVPETDKLHCEIDPEPPGWDYTIYVTAVRQKAGQGRTNELTLKLRDAAGKEHSVVVPVLVDRATSPAR